MRLVLGRHHASHLVGDEATDLSDATAAKLRCGDAGKFLAHLNSPRYDFDQFTVYVDYGDEPTIRNGTPKAVRLTLANSYKIQANVTVHWYAPAGWQVRPAPDSYVLTFPAHFGPPPVLEFQVLAEQVTQATNRLVVELTIAGRPTVMLVPIVLLNGNAVEV
jgi:hypothetical protein